MDCSILNLLNLIYTLISGFLLWQKRDRRRVQQNWVLVPEPPPLLRHGGPGQLGALHREYRVAGVVQLVQ